MTMKYSFEIRIGLLGHVSVGKTTILNALLKDKFSEVSMRRTTAGINLFRISTEATKWQFDDDEESRRSPSSTLDEIKADNAVLRKSNDIQEKTFDIELDEPLLEMCPDTKLVLVDLPGVNEAGSSQKYLNYVTNKWDTFDCMVVVMDARQGVNTEDHVKLLELVRQNNRNKKDVPTIILCNKVDDPFDEEVMELVDEVRHKVESVFQVPCRKDALDRLLKKDFRREIRYPMFLPLSAEKAFLYRMCESLSFDELCKQPISILNKIGRDAVGSSDWFSLSNDEKYREAFRVINNKTHFAKQIEMTNFDTFFKVLSICIGGDDMQKHLIRAQLYQSMINIRFQDGLVNELKSIHSKAEYLQLKKLEVTEFFCYHFEQLRHLALQDLDRLKLGELNECISQLIQFVEELQPQLAETTESTMVSVERCMDEMKGMIRKLFRLIIARASSYTVSTSSFVTMKASSDWVWDGGSSAYDVHGNYRQGCWRHKHTCEQKFQSKDNPPDTLGPMFKYSLVSKGLWQHADTKKLIVSETNPGNPTLTWELLSPHDWSTICGSILLLSSHKFFVESFGPEKHKLEVLQQEMGDWLSLRPSEVKKLRTAEESHFKSYGGTESIANAKHRKLLLEYLEGTYDTDHIFSPKDATKYGLVVQIRMPPSPSEPSHWGHIVWRYCQFMDRYEATHRFGY